MHIYYTYDYHNHKGESHRLLETAIADHLYHRYDPADPEVVFIDAGTAAGDEAACSAAAKLAAAMELKNEYGKPYIPGFPPFSLSHSNNAWAVLVADSECGLDIQYPRKADPDGIAGRFFAEQDAGYIRKVPEDFFRLWTRREALVKAVGSSVADSSIPSVLDSEAVSGGITYRISDLILPGSAGLCAAMCLEIQKQRNAFDPNERFR